MGRIIDSLVRNTGILMWMMWSTPCPSLRFGVSSSLISETENLCRHRLETFPSQCLRYNNLVKQEYMKEKHWIYAILMAAMESLPILHAECARTDIVNCVLAKAYLGASSKLLDNLNDEIHTVEDALDSLENYLCAMTQGIYTKKQESPVQKAESSACEIASWMYESVDHASPAFSYYVRDCATLVEGQISSLEHKNSHWPSLADYVNTIAEKSIGDVWIDIDLCQFGELDEDLLLLKESNQYIFKSSLLYDDVQDLLEDIETKSVNSAIVLALERDIISEDDLDEMDPADIVTLLRTQGVTEDIIHLADAMYLKGIYTFQKMERATMDKKGLLRSFQLVRVFNLRKLLAMNKDFKTLRRALASFSDITSLEQEIPEEINALIQ
ncbi:MAG: hypothetical protein PVF58_00370 [Candidatus Methanofastidiosia archaeon]|jgi:hypothetical protein